MLRDTDIQERGGVSRVLHWDAVYISPHDPDFVETLHTFSTLHNK